MSADFRDNDVTLPAISEAEIKQIKRLGKRGEAADYSEDPGESLAKRAASSKTAFRIIWALLALFAIALAATLFFYVQQSQTIAQQQGTIVEEQDSEAKTTTQTTKIPNLAVLLGKTEEAALKTVGRGAEVTDRSTAAEGSEYAVLVEAVLTTEKSSVKNGPLKLYLGLDKQGDVVMAGYRAPFTVLGYGSYSFTEAVDKAKIVQHVLVDASVCKSMAQVGDLSLPEDEGEYSTYEADGTTKVAQDYTFEGTHCAAGVGHWKAQLHYDFEEANSVGNLAYTRRSIEIFAYAK